MRPCSTAPPRTSRHGRRATSTPRHEPASVAWDSPGVGVHRRTRSPDGPASSRRRPADGAARPVAGAHDRARAHQRQRPARAGLSDAVDQLHPRRGIATLVRGARVARLRQATATSAGGIVIRFTDGTPELVVGKRRRERDGVTWTLPKGTPEADETTEQTAVREVREETGPRGQHRPGVSTSSSTGSSPVARGSTRSCTTSSWCRRGRPRRPRPRVRRGALDPVRRGLVAADLRDRAGPRRPGGHGRHRRHLPGHGMSGRRRR